MKRPEKQTYFQILGYISHLVLMFYKLGVYKEFGYSYIGCYKRLAIIDIVFLKDS